MSDTADFNLSEIARAEENHDHEFKYKIVVSGTANRSKHLSITADQLQRIKAVLRDGDGFRGLKNLNQQIKDFQIGNLKTWNYERLINDLLAFKEHAEQNEDNEKRNI